MKKNNISRRTFLKSSALVGAAGMVGGTGSVLTSCGENSGKVTYEPLLKPGDEGYYVPELPEKAPAGRMLKAGLIGCGGRGTGAAVQFIQADVDLSDADRRDNEKMKQAVKEGKLNVTITALADLFPDKIAYTRNGLKEWYGIEVPEENCFVGLDAYKKLIDSDVDVVLVATPPYFRPYHFQYAVEKGKHCFLEKPIFVDAKGYNITMVAAKQARAKNLCVVTGTQRHHDRAYVAAYQQIQNGLIGRITGGNVYWNGGHLWYRKRQPGWSDCEWMVRDWVNWKWLSGDHIVEQHVHNIDVFTWFSGLKPKSAVSFGSRQRRVTGDQYDNFSTDFEMENGIHLHSMCRQIDDCANGVYEVIQGTKGVWDGRECAIYDLDHNLVWKFDQEANQAAHVTFDPYILEHINLIQTIRKGECIEQASECAVATMAAVMARESAYSGKMVTWDEMVNSGLDYTPADLSLDGKMDLAQFQVAVPGQSPE